MINRLWVEVSFREGYGQPGNENEAKQIWFAIGSVEAFERNLVRQSSLRPPGILDKNIIFTKNFSFLGN